MKRINIRESEFHSDSRGGKSEHQKNDVASEQLASFYSDIKARESATETILTRSERSERSVLSRGILALARMERILKKRAALAALHIMVFVPLKDTKKHPRVKGEKSWTRSPGTSQDGAYTNQEQLRVILSVGKPYMSARRDWHYGPKCVLSFRIARCMTPPRRG